MTPGTIIALVILLAALVGSGCLLGAAMRILAEADAVHDKAQAALLDAQYIANITARWRD